MLKMSEDLSPLIIVCCLFDTSCSKNLSISNFFLSKSIFLIFLINIFFILALISHLSNSMLGWFLLLVGVWVGFLFNVFLCSSCVACDG
jgi:hypothetical protein